jgi:hypothetical protein
MAKEELYQVPIYTRKKDVRTKCPKFCRFKIKDFKIQDINNTKDYLSCNIYEITKRHVGVTGFNKLMRILEGRDE